MKALTPTMQAAWDNMISRTEELRAKRVTPCGTCGDVKVHKFSNGARWEYKGKGITYKALYNLTK